MRIEPNMYIRTTYGIIAKVVDNQDNEIIKTDDNTTHLRCHIKKAKYNILDLIEENDLAEVEYYSPRYEERITRLFEIDFRHKNNITFCNIHCQLNIFDGEWSKHDQPLKPVIKSIATKEQFDSVKYSLEGR